MNTRELQDTVRAFLREHKKMSLAITRSVGHPSLSVMHYALGETGGVIYFGTRRSFRKFALLQENTDISCLVVDGSDDPKRAVSIRGTAHECIGVERDLAYALFKQLNTSVWYVDGHDDLVMFKITPLSVHWLDGSSGTLYDVPVPLPLGDR